MIFEDEVIVQSENSLANDIAYNIIKVQAPAVWTRGYRGAGVVVAIIDSGVNYDHKDIKHNMWSNNKYPNHGYDFVNFDNDPMDDNGHGSHCAGIVAGDGSAGVCTGVAPDAKIMALKALNENGSGYSSHINKAIEFAIENGADILSMSFGVSGGGNESSKLEDRIIMTNVLNSGVIASVAAGNDGDEQNKYPIPCNISAPGNCPPPWLHPDQTLLGGLSCVVTVGATDVNDKIAYFSSIGPVTWTDVSYYNDYPFRPGMGLIKPDICAPGVNITSISNIGNSSYTVKSGTSMATPCVAGVMALILSKNHQLSPAKIDQIVEMTATPLSPKKSNTFGSGLINALKAVNSVSDTRQIILKNFSTNDMLGNNNGNINPCETIQISLSIENRLQRDLKNVKITLSTKNTNITILNSTMSIATLEARQLIGTLNAFSFVVGETTPIDEIIKFDIAISAQGVTDFFTASINIKDSRLENTSFELLDEYGVPQISILPGKQYDLKCDIQNIGNEAAKEVLANIYSASDELSFITNDIQIGNIETNETKSIFFKIITSLTIEPQSFSIPVNVVLTDYYGKQTEFSFVLSCTINVIFDLYDSKYNGWNGAAIEVQFDDGSQNKKLTNKSTSHEQYVLPISNATNVALRWIHGFTDKECSFNIYYDGGDTILQKDFKYDDIDTGYIFGWNNDCMGTIRPLNIKPPTDIVTQTTSNYGIEISWNYPISNPLYKFNIYRDFEKISSNVNGYQWGNLGLLPETNYCYSVSAVFAGCEESILSEQSCSTTQAGTFEIENDIKIFPNPTKEYLSVVGNNLKNIKICNSIYQAIFDMDIPNNGTIINVKKFPNGLYFIYVMSLDGSHQIRKFVKVD